MKKIVLILLVLLLIVFGLSCSGLIPAPKTSLITITVGSNQTASIKAEPATLAARITRFLARSVHMSTAAAAIPAVVVSLRVTVSAPDMQTITVNELVAGQTSIALLLEVPNGNARNFLLEGRDASNAVAYWNEFSLDLTGGLINQAVDMLFIGAAQSYLYVDVKNGNDNNAGTKSSPFRTITRALTVAGPNTSIFIEPGTYSIATGEAFPLIMKVNTALVGLGPNYTTVIDNSTGLSSSITGTTGAVVNGCRINTMPLSAAPASINDNAAAMTIISSLISGGSPTAIGSVCISVSGNTRIAKSTITRCTSTGITISGGSPTIEFNTITGNIGTGISVGGTTSPTITNNTINNNSTGIFVSGTPIPSIINNNSIYCNSAVDLNVSSTAIVDATLNSWDHDATTTPTGTPPGPTISAAGCGSGIDICGGALTYIPFQAAVPSPPACR